MVIVTTVTNKLYVNYLGCKICSRKPVDHLFPLNGLPVYWFTPHCPQEVNINVTKKSSYQQSLSSFPISLR